jgi:hypothetical protein
MLYIAREIIDEVIALSNGNHANTQQLWRWVGIELAIAVASDTCYTLPNKQVVTMKP